MPNCSASTIGAWLGSRTAPEPTRMRLVADAIRSITTAVAHPATPFIPWCSDTQCRW